jgi:hypothetical protein
MIMMTMIRRIFLLLVLVIHADVICGQETDYGIWGGVSGTYEFIKNFEAELKIGFKAEDKLSVMDQYYAEGGLSYKITKWLDAGASLKLFQKYEDDGAYHLRDKISAWVKGSADIGRIELSFRSMYQRSTRQYIEKDNDLIPEHYTRFRLKAEYDIPNSPLKPFIMAEPYIPLKEGDGFEVNKVRYSAGLEFKISKKSAIEAGWLMETFKKKSAGDLHVLDLEYKIKF